MKIYTKGGDKGMTALVGGSRVSKYDTRLHAYGTTDELNSWLGLIGDSCPDPELLTFIRRQQSILFDLGSNLASEKGQKRIPLPQVTAKEVELLEAEIDRMQAELPELRSFILPGGHPVVSYCHLARTVCRRAERWTVELMEREALDSVFVRYLNRLSDYLFIFARAIGQQLNAPEVPWSPNKD